MDNIVVDRSGNIQGGYFFELSTLQNEGRLSSERSITPKLDIISLRKPDLRSLYRTTGEFYVEANLGKVTGTEYAHDCTLDKTHITAEYRNETQVELSGGPRHSDLIYGDVGSQKVLLIPDPMAQRLKASSLRGYRLVKITNVDYSRVPNQALSAKNFQLYELQFRGRACMRGFSVHGAPNACPHCGSKPLICPECGHYGIFCPACGIDPWVVLNDHKGQGDKRLIAAGWNQWRPMVIDVNRWDGADFVFVTLDSGALRTNVVTKRVVDWLLSFHAAPFVARPVMARLDGATPEQLKLLEVAKGK